MVAYMSWLVCNLIYVHSYPGAHKRICKSTILLSFWYYARPIKLFVLLSVKGCSELVRKRGNSTRSGMIRWEHAYIERYTGST